MNSGRRVPKETGVPSPMRGTALKGTGKVNTPSNHGNIPRLQIQSETPVPPAVHAPPQPPQSMPRVGEEKILLPQIIPTHNPADGNARGPNSSPRTGNVAPGNNASMGTACNAMTTPSGNLGNASIGDNKLYNGHLKQVDIKPGRTQHLIHTYL